ncbi:hypothetical protein ECZU31_17720 [Escherichia coli]|nr:hypothetical protein ECZU31_17720 [Escherichia coli]
MKKLSLSLMLNVSLALMLALSLIYPQSVAAVLSPRAILATVICVVAGGVGVYATECAGTLRAGAAAGIAGREDCHVAVFAAGAVAQTGGGSGGDGGDVYLAGRCRVDFYRADLSCGVAVFPADT